MLIVDKSGLIINHNKWAISKASMHGFMQCKIVVLNTANFDTNSKQVLIYI